MSEPPVERVTAWQCIGCGKVEAPRPCIGVCQDKPIELVNAADYDVLQTRVLAMENMLRRLTMITPRPGEWERRYRLLQQQARQLLTASNADLLDDRASAYEA